MIKERHGERGRIERKEYEGRREKEKRNKEISVIGKGKEIRVIQRKEIRKERI